MATVVRFDLRIGRGGRTRSRDQSLPKRQPIILERPAKLLSMLFDPGARRKRRVSRDGRNRRWPPDGVACGISEA